MDTRLAVLGIVRFRHLSFFFPLSDRTATRQAHLRSDVRPNSPGIHYRSTSVPFIGVGTERLHLLLPITETVCDGCGASLDMHEHHRAVC